MIDLESSINHMVPFVENSLQRLDVFLMRRQMGSCGISTQTWIRASVSSCAVCGGAAMWLQWMQPYVMSQRWPMGFSSGEGNVNSKSSSRIWNALGCASSCPNYRHRTLRVPSWSPFLRKRNMLLSHTVKPLVALNLCPLRTRVKFK